MSSSARKETPSIACTSSSKEKSAFWPATRSQLATARESSTSRESISYKPLTQIVSLEKFALVGDEWLIGKDTFQYTSVALGQPTLVYSLEKGKFSSVKYLVGPEMMLLLRNTTIVAAVDAAKTEIQTS